MRLSMLQPTKRKGSWDAASRSKHERSVVEEEQKEASEAERRERCRPPTYCSSFLVFNSWIIVSSCWWRKVGGEKVCADGPIASLFFFFFFDVWGGIEKICETENIITNFQFKWSLLAPARCSPYNNIWRWWRKVLRSPFTPVTVGFIILGPVCNAPFVALARFPENFAMIC